MFPEANYRYTLGLDDSLYVMSFRWNVRGQYWGISLYTDDLLESIIESQKLVLNTNILDCASSKSKPIGILIAISNIANQITFDNITQEVSLKYIKKI